MNVDRMLSDLRMEHQQICEAIRVLERIAGGRRRLGRPPNWLSETAKQASTDTQQYLGDVAPKERRPRRTRPQGSTPGKSGGAQG